MRGGEWGDEVVGQLATGEQGCGQRVSEYTKCYKCEENTVTAASATKRRVQVLVLGGARFVRAVIYTSMLLIDDHPRLDPHHSHPQQRLRVHALLPVPRASPGGCDWPSASASLLAHRALSLYAYHPPYLCTHGPSTLPPLLTSSPPSLLILPQFLPLIPISFPRRSTPHPPRFPSLPEPLL